MKIILLYAIQNATAVSEVADSVSQGAGSSSLPTHIIAVIFVIAIIICIQIAVLINTWKKIEAFKSIFPQGAEPYAIDSTSIDTDSEESDNQSPSKIKVLLISVQSSFNATYKQICKALNMYLVKNTGAASDFHLMKDVVERYCDAEEEEIAVQQPIPLYLGLMGTMIGIIIGIGSMAITETMTSEKILENISPLMTSVAIAMAASFVGILSTTILSWAAKGASSKVEGDKNKFYSWLQTALLPGLNTNTASALKLLGDNLTNFNNTFSGNVTRLDQTLTTVRETSETQAELIKAINDIDIKKVAKANVDVLRELRTTTQDLGVFNAYLQNVGNYLTQVERLNNQLNEHLNRTAAIERMGTFFEEEINQVRTREDFFKQVVADVDDTMRKTFDELQQQTAREVRILQDMTVDNLEEIRKHMIEQQNAFAKAIEEQNEHLIRHIATEQENVARCIENEITRVESLSKEFSDLVKEVKDLGATKEMMTKMVEIAETQNKKISEVSSVINSKIKQEKSSSSSSGLGATFSKPLTLSIYAIVASLFLLLGVGVSQTISIRKSSKDESLLLLNKTMSEISSKIENLSSTITEIKEVSTTENEKTTTSGPQH